MRQLWLGVAVIALMSTPASAQYVTRYETPDKPSVEINLDILNERQEQDYHAQHDVVAEPLPSAVQQPPRLVAPAPAPEPEVVAEEEQAPAPRKRLLKPILTARTPQPAQQAITQEEMHTHPPVVKRSELPAYSPEDEELESEMAAVEQPAPAPAQKAPKEIKRSWSAVDDTPPPEELPVVAQGDVEEEPPVEEPSTEPVAAAEPVVTPEPAPQPVAMPAPVMAQADVPAVYQSHVTTKGSAIISHRPRYSDEAPRPEPVPAPIAVPVEPVVTQPAKRPSLVVVDEPAPEIPTPLPHRKPQIIEQPQTQAEAPVAQPEEPAVAATPEPQPEEADAMPVVPSLADLTLDFPGSSSDLTAASQKKLDGVIRQLAESIEGRLQVRGYATGDDGSQSSARRISLSRALAVRAYLMDKGIKPNRVDVQAKGSQTDRQPIDRVDLIFAR